MRAKLPLTPNLNLNLTRTRPHQPHLPSPPRRLHPLRTLTTTPPHLKKAQKTPPKRTAAVPLHASKTQAQSPTTTSDPFDFSDYSAGIKRAQERLRSELIKIKAGGRSAEEIEGLRVVLGQKGGGGDDGEKKGGENEGEKGRGKGKGEKAGKERVKLRDVASVVARGRNIGVLVGEKDVRSFGFLCCFVCYMHTAYQPFSPPPPPPTSGPKATGKELKQ